MYTGSTPASGDLMAQKRQPDMVESVAGFPQGVRQVDEHTGSDLKRVQLAFRRYGHYNEDAEFVIPIILVWTRGQIPNVARFRSCLNRFSK